ISANFLEVLSIQPLLGRGFAEGEDQPGAEAVVLLGHQVWQDDFAGDPRVVGRQVRINSQPGTIIGVMPPEFAFPLNHEVWVPLQAYASQTDWGSGLSHEVFGKRRAGVDIDQVTAELSTLMGQIADAHPETNEGLRVASVKPYVREFLGSDLVVLMHGMLLIGFLVLLVACANV